MKETVGMTHPGRKRRPIIEIALSYRSPEREPAAGGIYNTAVRPLFCYQSSYHHQYAGISLRLEVATPLLRILDPAIHDRLVKRQLVAGNIIDQYTLQR